MVFQMLMTAAFYKKLNNCNKEIVIYVGKMNRQITCIKYLLGMHSCNNYHRKLVCGLSRLSTTILHVLTRSSATAWEDLYSLA